MIAARAGYGREELVRTRIASGSEREEFLRAVFLEELRGKNERGDKTEASRGGGVTAPLPKRVTNAWLPFPSNETPGHCSGA